jgi:hypothetical protein
MGAQQIVDGASLSKGTTKTSRLKALSFALSFSVKGTRMNQTPQYRISFGNTHDAEGHLHASTKWSKQTYTPPLPSFGFLEGAI